MKQIISYITNNFRLDHTVFESPFDIPPHIHDCYEIFYFISGDLIYYIEGQAYELSPNDLIITNSRELHRIAHNSDAYYERKFIQFRPDYITSYKTNEYNIFNYLENRKLGHFNKVSANDVREAGIDVLWEKIEEISLDSSTESQILIKTYFIQMLISINKIFSKYDNPLVNQDKCDNPLVNQSKYDEKIVIILDFINENLDKKITLDLLQHDFFVNKYYLCHIFKRNTGFTVMEYLTYKRIMWAMELLMSGVTAIDVANTVGFGDYSTFYKAFKNITGFSPRQYYSQQSPSNSSHFTL